jgi:hypothetical protein
MAGFTIEKVRTDEGKTNFWVTCPENECGVRTQVDEDIVDLTCAKGHATKLAVTRKTNK